VPTTQADVAALRTRNAAVVTLAKRALAAFWGTLDFTDPYRARYAILEFLPELVAQYGQVAATVAADWYETVRAKDVNGTFTAILADATPVEQVQANVRYQATPLFSGDPSYMLQTLGGSLQRHVVNTSRFTIRDNVARDPAKPRFARVPQGKTCAWCTMLASRGFVYRSERSAGSVSHFHNDCDCQIVADWSDHPAIEGYHPEHLYGLYSSARAASGSGDQKVIAAEMRRMHPDAFTDGVATGET
jgi:hypothetical protein